ncbi:MAG TPA: cation diffusion facilitator family transporter [Candidatus Obscuribacterales bacterium]
MTTPPPAALPSPVTRQTHPHAGGHAHSHGAIAPSLVTSERGLWAVKWSLVGLLLTALVQGAVFWLSGSVALLGDLIHNLGDAMTALPLGLAFWAARWPPSARFAYGYGRLEDLAGVAIVAIILGSAGVTAYESVDRFYHPQPLHHLGALAIAAIVGFLGNEIVALFRIRVGREINSAALVADGYHALTDGLVSLAVLLSAVGVGLGYAWVDPLVGLVITSVLLKIVWESGQTIFSRLLDGVEPEEIETLRHAIAHVPEVSAIESLRARWVGHRLYVEVALTVTGDRTIREGQAIATTVAAALEAHVPYLGDAAIRIVG